MKRRSLAWRWSRAAAIAAASLLLLAGCGSGTRSPTLSSLPLVHGARVVAQVRRCDPGARPYCALELVVADPLYSSSRGFVLAERNLLRAHGWTGASPQTSDELADESPGHKFRVTYATAYGDLKGIDLGWIERTDLIQRSLSSQLFAGTPAMSAQLQIGSQ
ncbi:MAG: hypothetical protein JO342_18740 [Solirubrobacterales bacterium]|nr:hypothetical protein [Solirubrobacterales bacterium]MBV9168181.1 hypothetical protein [Solirubrobacterales bacterium]